jgi:hypothetical protein
VLTLRAFSRYLCVRHGQRAVPEVLERWIVRRAHAALPREVSAVADL